MYTPDHLQTSRLRLRPFTIEDASELFRYASDAEFSKYLNYDAPSSKDDAIDFLRMVLAGEMGTNL
jgi:ribosomal-protein-alanine N-acetyltransferase